MESQMKEKTTASIWIIDYCIQIKDPKTWTAGWNNENV